MIFSKYRVIFTGIWNTEVYSKTIDVENYFFNL